jgi:hypothetical protein
MEMIRIPTSIFFPTIKLLHAQERPPMDPGYRVEIISYLLYKQSEFVIPDTRFADCVVLYIKDTIYHNQANVKSRRVVHQVEPRAVYLSIGQ